MTDRQLGGPAGPPASAPEAGPNASSQSGTGWFSRVVARALSLRGQLIIPYALLTLVTAMLGTYVVTRLVTSSVRERFVNQLNEASRVAADGVVRRERSHLRSLRLMTFTSGVAEGLQFADAEALEALLLPIALNDQAESVVAIGRGGREILGLTFDPASSQYDITRGSDFSKLPIVDNILQERRDAAGDKYVGIVETSYGPFLYTSAPVRNAADELVGVLMLGTRLDSLVDDLKSQALADVVLQQPDGALLSTSFDETQGEASDFLLPPESTEAIDGLELREFELYGRDFQAGYAPWAARDQVLGVLGVALPSNFLVTAEATSRNTFSLLFSISTISIIVVGYWLASSITRPILRLRRMAQAVAAGDLEQESGIQRPDEIGDLATAFDTMADDLQARTAEAEQLYAEAVDRNRQLEEMYQRLQSAQQQLVQSEKLASVGQLSAGIVHDVKNPLGVIKGVAEEMLEDKPPGSPEYESLQVIRDNASRANAIVTDMLTFARQTPPAMLRRDLRQTVEGSLRLTSYMLRKGKVELDLQVPPAPVTAMFDSQQLQQVVINLVQNAVQAMPNGGRLGVRLAPDDGHALIEVRDTGTGISPENLPRVFDPFFTTKPEGQGTGMGLSVSYGIISRHNGTISVSSKPGEGTLFTVRLPLDAAPAAGDQESEA
ncbi:MAG: ATP-binding protein [Anaerolineales bacterium]|nr:ATP-binding protein [Anaerolineales bacterium]